MYGKANFTKRGKILQLYDKYKHTKKVKKDEKDGAWIENIGRVVTGGGNNEYLKD